MQLSQFIFTIFCDSKYISAAKNIPAPMAKIFITFFIANPIRKPISTPNPTVVKSGLKLLAAAAILSIATFASSSFQITFNSSSNESTSRNIAAFTLDLLQ